MNRLVIASAALCMAHMCHATVLTFSNLKDDAGAPIGLEGHIPQQYGDNVTSTSDAYGDYLMGNGWTPDVVASYETVNANGVQVHDYDWYWSTSYGDLVDVLTPSQPDGYARVTLTGVGGKLVKLNSFDMAAWPTVNLGADRIHVIDGNGNDLWSSSNLVVHGAGPSHDTYLPAVTASQLTIEFGISVNIGADNINFDQVDSVPEPATLAVLGLGALALKRRRR